MYIEGSGPLLATVLGDQLQGLPLDRALVAVAVSSALLGAWILIVWRLRARILHWIDQRMLQVTRRLGSHRLRRIGIKQLKQLSSLLVRSICALLLFGGIVLWLALNLELFPQTHAIGDQLVERIGEELGDAGHAVLKTLPELGVVVVIFFLTRVANEFLNHYFDSIKEGDVKSELFDEVTAEVTRRLAGVGLWLAALVIAYPYIPGSDSAAFKGVTILAGLMVSLGSSSFVGQLVNGLMVVYSHTLKPGDYVEAGGTVGTVTKLGLFSCQVRTVHEELVVIPNSVLASGLKNFSRPREGSSVRFVTTVTIGYDTPWQQVHELLLAAAKATPEIRHDPAPVVRQAALEDFYVRYELVFAPADPARRPFILSELHSQIQERFHAAGLQIMSPNYVADPTAPKIPSAQPNPAQRVGVS